MSATTLPKPLIRYQWWSDFPSTDEVNPAPGYPRICWVKEARAELDDSGTFAVYLRGPWLLSTGEQGSQERTTKVSMTAQQPEWLVVLMADALDRLRR